MSVAVIEKGSEAAEAINRALARWRQGDLALDEHTFFHGGDSSQPLTTESNESDAESGLSVLLVDVPGLVVVTQTCDVVRDCTERPYIEVCPLYEVDAARYELAKKGRTPQHATLSGAPKNHVVDLSRVLTLEKSVVAGWRRTPGAGTDEEVRRFAEALARKRARFAFPDDFNTLASKFLKRLKDKHDKSSAEGESLRGLREIRVAASPSWDDDVIELFFWFIRHDDDNARAWSSHLEVWLNSLACTPKFAGIEGIVATLSGMTAEDFVQSDRLDLDHLSNE